MPWSPIYAIISLVTFFVAIYTDNNYVEGASVTLVSVTLVEAVRDGFR